MVVVERYLGMCLVEEIEVQDESLTIFVAAGRKNLKSMKGGVGEER